MTKPGPDDEQQGEQATDVGEDSPRPADSVTPPVSAGGEGGRVVPLRLPVVHVRFSTRRVAVPVDRLPRAVMASARWTAAGARRAAVAAAEAGVWVARWTRSRFGRQSGSEPEEQRPDNRPRQADDGKSPKAAADRAKAGKAADESPSS
ncbi:hypothetical protein [Couchioplanes caeruleus]|uniref:Uncharacterized protein n=1 Tax=Couchioplanes caeruleus subsp. caeruleus TaxID=56427 RepID=A0A1K0F9G3_9ACTN|nr:hypothetical protein [Couchioplanes caeruleus]OJF09495.1 hypothetical protein BG844_37195 [Couchioplanes caeruleus subsp. caeruleus]